SITEDAVPNSVSGNVVTNDTVGADGANVTAITSTNAPGNTATNTADVLEIVGEFGTLTINPDGSYTYALDNDNLVVQGLSENQTLTDTFTYTLTDGDTDTASADLVITINGTNDGVTLDVPVDTTATTPDGDTTDQVVFESGLTGGSNPNAADTQVASSFTLKALDGLAATDAVTIAYTDANGDAANLVLSKADIENLGTTNQTITTQYGELVLNGYAQAADGTITVDYEYTLTNAPAVDATDVTDSFGITAKDDGVETETATQNLDIKIVDDAPTAVDDA
ncbi:MULTISPECIES: VCBS domain-containing protein, partial [unclassified Halomonas]|uniref:VCBS domain-containing protein n=1 Tax=unclassified Halomonas TaxID=2609666 RepID=UPI002888C10B